MLFSAFALSLIPHSYTITMLAKSLVLISYLPVIFRSTVH
jgi:hypothetical protein